MKWKIVAVLLIAACVLIGFFPHYGPPHFRYTGSDPSEHVWNLGWPLATAIYDSRSGLHVGPFAYVLLPIEAVVLVVAGVVIRVIRVRAGKAAEAA